MGRQAREFNRTNSGRCFYLCPDCKTRFRATYYPDGTQVQCPSCKHRCTSRNYSPPMQRGGSREPNWIKALRETGDQARANLAGNEVKLDIMGKPIVVDTDGFRVMEGATLGTDSGKGQPETLDSAGVSDPRGSSPDRSRRVDCPDCTAGSTDDNCPFCGEIFERRVSASASESGIPAQGGIPSLSAGRMEDAIIPGGGRSAGPLSHETKPLLKAKPVKKAKRRKAEKWEPSTIEGAVVAVLNKPERKERGGSK